MENLELINYLIVCTLSRIVIDALSLANFVNNFVGKLKSFFFFGKSAANDIPDKLTQTDNIRYRKGRQGVQTKSKPTGREGSGLLTRTSPLASSPSLLSRLSNPIIVVLLLA